MFVLCLLVLSGYSFSFNVVGFVRVLGLFDLVCLCVGLLFGLFHCYSFLYLRVLFVCLAVFALLCLRLLVCCVCCFVFCSCVVVFVYVCLFALLLCLFLLCWSCGVLV